MRRREESKGACRVLPVRSSTPAASATHTHTHTIAVSFASDFKTLFKLTQSDIYHVREQGWQSMDVVHYNSHHDYLVCDTAVLNRKPSKNYGSRNVAS